jgi:hypothetical protein
MAVAKSDRGESIAPEPADGMVAPTWGEQKAGTNISGERVWGHSPLIFSLAKTATTPSSPPAPETDLLWDWNDATRTSNTIAKKEDLSSMTFRRAANRRSMLAES